MGEKMNDLIPIETFAEAQIATKKVMDEWDKERILSASKACTPYEFGELIYDIQSQYKGENQRYFCSMVYAHFFQSIMEILSDV